MVLCSNCGQTHHANDFCADLGPSNAEVIASLQGLTLAVRMFGLDGLRAGHVQFPQAEPRRTPARVPVAAQSEGAGG